jgi:penicillin amidase/acyl-homoserine-lactone acylase
MFMRWRCIPQHDNQYRLDDEWHELEHFDIPIKVLLWGWLPWTVHEDGYRSIHGPVMKTEHGTYAVRYAGNGRNSTSRAMVSS